MAPHLGHHLPEHSPPEPILLDQINLRLINETERTVRCVLQRVDTEAIKKVLIQWKADQQPMRPTVAHLDGKLLKNATRLPHMHLTGRCSPRMPRTPPRPTRAN